MLGLASKTQSLVYNRCRVRPRNWIQTRSLAALASAEARVGHEVGEEKPILMDRFGRRHNYLRISLTEKCNLRCTYCMPEEGIQLKTQEEMLSNDEILRVVECFVKRGVDKIRLTGGEPLIRSGIEELCRDIKSMGVRDLAITTNGILLKRKLDPLVEAGVNLLNISLDTLLEPKFELITRRRGFATVLESIHRAIDHPGLDNVKVNCVVKRGVNEDELHDFVSWTEHKDFEVRFIEYMPFEGNKWDRTSMLSYFEMVDQIRGKWPGFSRERSLDGQNTVSKSWQVPGFKGRVGFISSMSDHFCGSCNRMRLTADGNIKACLFGEEELSLRAPLRAGASDEELGSVIEGALSRKHEKLGGHNSPEAISKGKNRAMIQIGG